MFRALPQPDHANRITERSKDAADSLARELKNIPFLDGKWIRGVNLAVGLNEIPHGLGRQAKGWIVTDRTTHTGVLFRNTMDKRNLVLFASVAHTIDVWVF